MKNALIIGATGAVGSILLKRLYQDTDIKTVYVIARRPISGLPDKCQQLIFSDLRPNDLTSLEIPDIDVAFCCLGTTIANAGSQHKFRAVDYELVLAFGQLAAFNEIPSLHVISAIGANSSAMSFYSRVKGEAEDALSTLAIKELWLYRPSLLINAQRSDFRLGETVAEYLSKPLNLLGIGKSFSGIEVNKVAAAMHHFSTQQPEQRPQIISSKRMHRF